MNINDEIGAATKRVGEWINRSAAQHTRAMRNKQEKKVSREVNVTKVSPSAQLPSYATAGAGCFDLRACVDQPLIIQQGAQMIVGTGLAFAVPDGHVMNIVSRSGHTAKARVTVSNSPGKIDSDYRGEVMVILQNNGDHVFIVRHGDRIAQAEIVESPQWSFNIVGSLDDTARGVGGFGSTGAE